MRLLMTGNEAIARGAYEAGVRFGSAYPGTPSTEIFEELAKYKDALYCEWAPNEKVAAEAAYGAAIGGVRSLAAMKHVGLNVAADLIFSAAYAGVLGGFVLVSADDPDLHSSQNEQDNRHYARAAKLAMVEPSDSQECLDFMKEAYRISEEFDIPVLFRVTTRVCHSKSLTETGERIRAAIKPYVKAINRYVCTPANSKANRTVLEQKQERLKAYANRSPLNRTELKGTKLGIVTSSIAYQYAKEAFPEDASFLKLGFTYPLPIDLIRDFASKVDELYIVEELDPFMEEQIRAAGIPCKGKELIPCMYELNPEIVREAVSGVRPETMAIEAQAVGRPPVLCAGCPHRGFFYSLSKIKDVVVTGDIGCYTLGAMAPLNAIDTCLCMGGGFSLGMGLSKALELSGRKQKVFGVLGDSTFFHSGLAGAVEIIYNRGNVVPCVLDNSITGMTGHQDNPGSGMNLLGGIAPAVSIEKVLAAFGYENILVVDPNDLSAMQGALKSAQESTLPTAIISRRACLLNKRSQHEDFGKCAVDREKCMGCKLCLKAGCPAISVIDGKAEIDRNMCAGCKVCAQICGKGAIERSE